MVTYIIMVLYNIVSIYTNNILLLLWSGYWYDARYIITTALRLGFAVLIAHKYMVIC